MRLIALVPLLAGCAGADDTDKVGETDGDSAGVDDTASTGDSADTGESAETGETAETADSDETADPRDDRLDALLAALRADRDATLLAQSRGDGWPAPVEGGLLFVTTERGEWQLAGDHSAWVGEPMTCEAAFCWLVREAAAGGGYKFTDGVDWVADPWSRALAYDEFGEMSRVLPEGEGHLERQFAVEGAGLVPRTLHLWVPGGPIERVLYAHDGQNLFDPGAMWGGWRLDESVPEGMLVVGIANTPDRMEEYTHVEDRIYGDWYGGWGDAYADFVMESVRPLIRDTYGEPGPVGLLGSSLGGLVSFHVADRYPGQFAFAASMSGTMGWGSIGADNETMIERYAAAGLRDTALYLDSGGDGDCYDADGDGIEDDDPDAADNYCENVQLRDVLYAAGYEFEVDLWHWWEPGADHDEQAWAERVWRPLEIFAAL